MNISEIRNRPTCVDSVPVGCSGVHESTLRAYQILEKAKDFMRRGTPSDVVLELIAEMEDRANG
jgi:hypothetical protein